MSRTDETGAPYRRRADDRRSRSSRVATVGGVVILVLLVLYYMVAATAEVRELRGDLEEAQRQTLIARAAAAEERQDTLERLTLLQTDLDNARAEVASLREQLIAAGITPVIVAPASAQAPPSGPAPAPQEPQEAAGAPETAPEVQPPPAAAPVAPGPAPVAPAAPVDPPALPAPAPAPTPDPIPAVTVGGEHLLCVLTICL